MVICELAGANYKNYYQVLQKMMYWFRRLSFAGHLCSLNWQIRICHRKLLSKYYQGKRIYTKTRVARHPDPKLMNVKSKPIFNRWKINPDCSKLLYHQSAGNERNYYRKISTDSHHVLCNCRRPENICIITCKLRAKTRKIERKMKYRREF